MTQSHTPTPHEYQAGTRLSTAFTAGVDGKPCPMDCREPTSQAWKAYQRGLQVHKQLRADPLSELDIPLGLPRQGANQNTYYTVDKLRQQNDALVAALRKAHDLLIQTHTKIGLGAFYVQCPLAEEIVGLLDAAAEKDE